MNVPNNGAWVEIGRNTVTVAHNDDGNKTISIVGSGGTNLTSWSSTSCSGSVSLNKIPRQTVPTFSAGTHYFGETLGIIISPAKNTFTHTITYSWAGGTATGTIVTGYASGTYEWTVPASFMNDIPSATQSSALVITVATYDGGSLLGTTNVAVTMTVPSSVIPTVDTITCTDTGGNIPASWAVFVKSLSTLHVNVSASGAYGSTITGYLIEALNQSIIQNNSDIGVIDSSGSVTVEVTVTDSRGRTGTATATISVVDYDIPEIESCVVERTNSQGIPTENGTYLRVTLGCSVSSVDHHNEMTVRIYYKASTDDDRTLARTIHEDGVISIQGEIFMISGMNVAKTYTIEVEVQDIITAAPTKISGIIQSEGAIISCRYGGTGIAFGRTAETAYQADFGWEIRGRQGAIFDTPLLPASGGTGVTSLQALIGELLDYIYPVGSLYWSSRSTDPGDLFGGTWTPITDRFVLAAGSTYAAGGSGGAASASHKHLAPVGYNANHTHGIVAINGTVAGGNGAHYETATAPNYGTLSSNVTMAYTGNESISTMPPYVVKYCWERTA
jgi:hypothetical protein